MAAIWRTAWPTSCLGVSDVARSVAFYRDTLGLPLSFSTAASRSSTAGPVTLMLSLEIGKARDADRRRDGNGVSRSTRQARVARA